MTDRDAPAVTADIPALLLPRSIVPFKKLDRGKDSPLCCMNLGGGGGDLEPKKILHGVPSNIRPALSLSSPSVLTHIC